jgi:tetraacyldisaccharide 4'-kinase
MTVVVAVRNQIYDRCPPPSSGIPTLSVGNLHAGGTGKTPLILAMLKLLETRSVRACVLLRGYGSEGGVSDEAEMYVKQCGADAVFVGSDRRANLEKAKQAGFECAILDDAFQHRRAHRDANLVLIDATRSPLEDHLLPAGFLREGMGALRRADEVWLTRVEQSCEVTLEKIKEAVLDHGLEAYHVKTQVEGLRPFYSSLAKLEGGSKVFCVSAIGHPENFKSTTASAGFSVVGQKWFPDHHHFSEEEQLDVLRRAKALGAVVVLTSKDAIKWTAEGPIYVLEISSVLPQPQFNQLLERCLSHVS